MQRGILNWARKYHKWPALVISFFLILFALSGIILNHRALFSGIDVSRKILPRDYRLKNWNLGSVRSSTRLNDGSILLFGNSGIWKTDSLFLGFSDFNPGLPDGMDNRKVRVVKQTQAGSLLVGTFFGLFEYSPVSERWIKVSLPVKNERIQEIISLNNRVYVMTRSEILTFYDRPGLTDPEIIQLREPEGYDKKINLFRFLWITHSGEIAGFAGRLFLDLLAVLILVLVSTGLIVFFIPKIARRLKSGSGSLPDLRRSNLRLHNKLGAWFFIFLLLAPLTGIFLRPPFLIPIANARIPFPPLRVAGKDNPWEDKLRSAVWSPETGKFIISTSDGIFYCDSLFAEMPVVFSNQPPVSVMGINVFEPAGDGNIFVGSFDGLFLWNPQTGNVTSLTGDDTPSGRRRTRAPTSGDLVSGMIINGGRTFVFDYDRGVISLNNTVFPEMPEIIQSSPMPLWNVAQEFHTGRIYQSFLGPFYILIVPLVGLFTILVFITGYIRWRKIYRRPASIRPATESIA